MRISCFVQIPRKGIASLSFRQASNSQHMTGCMVMNPGLCTPGRRENRGSCDGHDGAKQHTELRVQWRRMSTWISASSNTWASCPIGGSLVQQFRNMRFLPSVHSAAARAMPDKRRRASFRLSRRGCQRPMPRFPPNGRSWQGGYSGEKAGGR
ncbi:hypothetical protein VTI28DRAFT_5188 [Corynascus sepedonium]